MAGDNNWTYFMCCPVVTASCTFYEKEMSGFWHDWAFYEPVYSARSALLWDGMLSSGPTGLARLIYVLFGLSTGRASNDQILYCLLIDGPRAKARGCSCYLSPNLTIFIRMLWVGATRVGVWPLSPCWWMASVWANLGIYFMHFHIVVMAGGGVCFSAL